MQLGIFRFLLTYGMESIFESSPSSILPHLVVHDGVDKDGDAVLGKDLLRGDLVGGRPHVDLLVDVDAGDDEEHTRSSGAS